MSDLLSIADLAGEDLVRILELAEAPDLRRPLQGKGVALVFEKPSARTRNSMEMATVQLGGHPVYLQPAELGIGRHCCCRHRHKPASPPRPDPRAA